MIKKLGFLVVVQRWNDTLAGVASVFGMVASAIIAFLEVKNGESSWAVTNNYHDLFLHMERALDMHSRARMQFLGTR